MHTRILRNLSRYPDKTFNPAVKNEKGEYVADETYKSVEGGHFVEGNLPRNESQAFTPSMTWSLLPRAEV